MFIKALTMVFYILCTKYTMYLYPKNELEKLNMFKKATENA